MKFKIGGMQLLSGGLLITLTILTCVVARYADQVPYVPNFMHSNLMLLAFNQQNSAMRT